MDAPAKQQVVERLKSASNILVTVSTNPSVDQLAACIGLTLMLNKMGKHANAVFSGKVPSTIEFLQPEKTLEVNTDSLRDFIISLDKSKADKLRYKVEDQAVKIFITPYKTSISEKDLVFSQGDFNVEAVIALGVQDRTQLDAAITAHGRILHDATVISVGAGAGKPSTIGNINWQEPSASSLSEMVVSISEALGPNLIDNQMATAFLTGIVAETNRFSNNKTSPKVMTMSAQLMAAGANQQLIVQKLNPPPPPPPPKTVEPPKTKPAKEMPSQKPQKPQKQEAPDKKEDTMTLNVSHEPSKADGPEVNIDPHEIHIDEQGNLKTAADLQGEIDRLNKLKAEAEKSIESAESQAAAADKKAEIPVEAPPEPIIVEQPPVAPPTPLPPPPLPQPAVPLPPIDKNPFEPINANPPQPDAGQSQHAFLDPIVTHPVAGGPFTANTTDDFKPVWAGGNFSAPFDPLNNPARSQENMFGHEKVVQPLSAQAPASPWQAPAQPPYSVDTARSAVENAFSAQPTPSVQPPQVDGFGVVPMPPGSPVPPPQPIANGSTPSLSLPQNGNGMPPPPPTPPPLPPLPPTSY